MTDNLALWFSFMGLLIGGGGCGHYWWHKKRYAGWEKEIGLVVDLAERKETGSNSALTVIYYAAYVRFSTKSGCEHTFKDEWWSSPSRHQVGERVELLYDPKAPKHAILPPFSIFQVWFFGLTGLAFCLFGAWIWFVGNS